MPNPLELQTTPGTANVPLFTQIMLTTSVDKDGKLQVGAHIYGAYGHVDDYGLETEKWENLGPGKKPAVVPNLLKLPEDLAHLAPTVEAAWPVIVGLCQGINAVRKIV